MTAFTKQYFRRKVLFAKAESTYGTDAEPTGALNAILTRDLTIEPLNGEALSRELDKSTFGADPGTRVGVHARITFQVEIAGSGDAGDLPAYHPLMLGSGHSFTVLDDGGGTPVDIAVRYRPQDTGTTSLTLYVPFDRTLHKVVGARGSLRITGAKRQYGYMEFEFLGLIESITDQANMPETDLSAFVKPVPFRESTVNFSAFGATRAMHSFTLTGGQQVAFYEHSESESIEQEDRNASFEALVQQQLVADWGIWNQIQTDTLGAISMIWAPAADTGDNTFGLYVPNAQILEVSQADEQGVKAIQISGPCTTDGTDPDYEIIVGVQPA